MKEQRKYTVAVKTGKVSVYAKGDDVDTKQKDSSEEIILTPNQEVVYNTIDENFSRKIVDDPQIILEKPTLFAMEYDDDSSCQDIPGDRRKLRNRYSVRRQAVVSMQPYHVDVRRRACMKGSRSFARLSEPGMR